MAGWMAIPRVFRGSGHLQEGASAAQENPPHASGVLLIFSLLLLLPAPAAGTGLDVTLGRATRCGWR